MQTQGLAYFELRACSPEDFDRACTFYRTFGFVEAEPSSDETHSTSFTLLTLSAEKNSLTTDITIKLVLCRESVPASAISKDSDWALHDHAIVFATTDIPSTIEQLTQIEAPFQEKLRLSSEGPHTIYALDPLNNMVAFTTKPSLPHMLNHGENAVPNPSGNNPETSLSRIRKIGVLTSGGDAPGMNAVVRAVVRYGITKGCEVYAIHEGYQGLVDGGDRIQRMDWKSVRGWLAVGGTTIGTARCMPFKTREGRLQAAQNLVSNGIDSIIVCGGDGSLTGADVFRSEWSDLLAELKSTGRITEEEATTYGHLTIVGLVGSIDNDMASTDITIGAVTSLHRICESVDSIGTTALSHSRAFVIEVMGRHCGWLALMAGIATGADFVFIPERPPLEDDWESEMCAVAHHHRKFGKRKTVIIVAEGAIDKFLNPIKAEYIKDILTDRLKLDTRVTTLGHTQRGGSPAAFDRILATIQSVEAVEAVLRSTPETPSPLIGMANNEVTCQPLMKAVELTHEVAKAIGKKDFARAMELRDPQFAEEYEAFSASTVLDGSNKLPKHLRMNIAIIHVGAPAGGMNAATRTAVRYALSRGHKAYAIFNGFSGLVDGSVEELTWIGVDGWTSRGGSELGTNRHVPGRHEEIGKVASQLQKFNIQGLMIIGGFEAFLSLMNLEAAREKYPSLCIPMCVLPATVSNNVPGTDFSLGADTSLNAIIDACDSILQSARSSRRRVFVVEVQGGRSGFLAVKAGLASGANTIYIPEEGINLARLQSDVLHLMALYEDDDPSKSEGRIVLRNETASKTYTTDVISAIFKDEGHATFDSRTAVLGHIQQGNTPSPLDRIRATRLATYGVQFIETQAKAALDAANELGLDSLAELKLTDVPESAAVVGILGLAVQNNSVRSLQAKTDFQNRKPKDAWWFKHRSLVDTLSGRGLFTPEAQALLQKRS